ncbi:MAG TPA: Uma2 family endonuclease [Kofleriaceae bacterium]|nr:Uma2 family endonuclease [Kofleriaceae bacterium]
MVATRPYEDTIQVPGAVRFPVELELPDGFDPARLETWPVVEGRLEFVEGRLRYMPPCGDMQQDTVTDVVIVLGAWVRARPGEFVLGTNEAGMRLRGATRAADAAVWRRPDAEPRTGGLRTSPPVLAVEVAGRHEPEDALQDKAQWYLRAGVEIVWIVLPEQREVIVVTPSGRARHQSGERVPESAALPDLAPAVDDFFVQLAGG